MWCSLRSHIFKFIGEADTLTINCKLPKKWGECPIKEAEEIYRIEQACFSEPWTAETAQYQLSQDSTVHLITREENTAVGYALGIELGGEAELYRLAVLPERRRKGLGEALLTGFLNECARRGAGRVFLEVRSKNIPAVTLYKKAGFQEIAVRKGYYDDDDAVVMEYEII